MNSEGEISSLTERRDRWGRRSLCAGRRLRPARPSGTQKPRRGESGRKSRPAPFGPGTTSGMQRAQMMGGWGCVSHVRRFEICVPRAQRLRAGLTYGAPTALKRAKFLPVAVLVFAGRRVSESGCATRLRRQRSEHQFLRPFRPTSGGRPYGRWRWGS